ncbi:MAG: hypothetical protein WCC11_03350 [Gammaproteobacteria bacterium]
MLLLVKLVVSIITFISSKTNILQGCVHLQRFLAHLLFVLRSRAGCLAISMGRMLYFPL